MVEVMVKFLGATAQTAGAAQKTLALPDGATLRDLEAYLRALGIDLDTEEIIVTLNSRGLGQWPAGRRFVSGDVVAVFPNITGG